MTFSYKPQGVCSRVITFDIDENLIVSYIAFTGGCGGNTQGVSKLAEGMNAHELIKRLKGIECGMRPTSCPDQLASAVEAALEEM